MIGKKQQEQIRLLEKKLRIAFKDKKLLLQAVTHPSARTKGKPDYERLEFLGDAVLDVVTAEMLLNEYPLSDEGTLSKLRAALVNAKSLAEIARTLSITELIIMSKSEEASGARNRDSLLADVFEAIVGAVYLDQGFNKAKKWLEKLFSAPVKTVVPQDPKTELQEFLQAQGIPVPEYRLKYKSGPDHSPEFVYSVIIEDKEEGTGRGKSKKEAQQKAAFKALQKLNKEKKI
ncbi:MAG: ribonuclease III [Candidatus Dadabacteria bacterium]|nr:MAG: ribonuclease III [Candidatus Dadabacteria bacterium]